MAKSAPAPSYVLGIDLLRIPLKEYSAAPQGKSRFTNMHAPCVTPGQDATLREAKFCAACNERVTEETTVAVYEGADGSQAIFTPAEIKALKPERDKVMTAISALKMSTVDPLLLHHPSWLGPVDKHGQKGYQLLWSLLWDLELGLMVRYIDYGRYKIGFIRSTPLALMLHEVHYAPEVRMFTQQVRIPIDENARPEQKEIDLGGALIKAMLFPGPMSDYVQTLTDPLDQIFDKAIEARLKEPTATLPAPSGRAVALALTAH